MLHSIPRATTLAVAALVLTLAAAGCHRSGDVASLMAAAQRYHAQGDSRAAIIELKNLLQANPNHGDARSLLGELYLEQGDPVSAEKEVRRGGALGQPAARTLPLLGRAMLMQGHYEQLIAELPASPAPAELSTVLKLRANAALGLGKQDAAKADFERVPARQESDADALLGLARIAAAHEQMAEAASLVARAVAAHPEHAECMRFQGDLLRVQGKPVEAMAVYRNNLARHPHSALAHVDIANLLIDNGKFTDAHAELDAARKSADSSLLVLHAQAMLDYREGKPKAARDALQLILRAAPDHFPSILLMGTVQLVLGSLPQAEQQLTRFLRAYPQHPFATLELASTYLNGNNPDAALALLRPYLAAHPDDAEHLALAGEACLRQRQYAAAGEYFQRASALRPQAPQWHTALALSRLGDGDSGRAVAELERAGELEQGATRSGVLLVMAHLRAKAPDKALAVVLQLEKKGNNALLANLKGITYLAQQEMSKARGAFEHAMTLDPVYVPALDNLAQLDALEGHAGDADKRYRAALARAPKNTALMEALARVAAADGQRAEAIAWLEQARQADPAALPAGLRLADFYLRAGDAAKAEALAVQLDSAHPGTADVLAMLAQCQVAAGKLGAAADTYTRLAGLLPGNALPHVRLASVQLAQHDDAGALQSLRRALALDPEQLDAQLTLLNVLIDQKKFDAGLALARDVERRHPDAAAGYKLEGDVLSAQAKFEPALAAYEHAFALGKRGALLVQVHGTLVKLGRVKDADARMALWLQAHPADVPSRLYYASSRLVAQDLTTAMSQFAAVLHTEPNNIVALNDLAWACQQSGDKRALGYAEQAYRLAPNSPVIMDTLASVYAGNGKAAQALPLLQKASALAPDASDIRYRLGVALAGTGDRRGARRELERALASPKPFAKREQARALLATL